MMESLAQAQSGNRSRRIAYLDGLRGIAILSVIGIHWGQHAGLAVFTGGYVGVDIFFVLSGFLITDHLLRRRITYREFMVRRAWRLLPALSGMLVSGVILCFLIPQGQITARHAIRAAAVSMFQGSSLWSAFGGPNLDPFGITWSLSAEWYFYAIWPLVLGWLVRRSAHSLTASLVGLAGVIYVASLTLPAHWFYFGPTARMAELLVGAALASLVRTSRTAPPIWLILAVVTLAGGWMLRGDSDMSAGYRFIGLPAVVLATCLLILMGLSRPDSFLIRMLGNPVLSGIGLISYSAYLWHALPLAILPANAFGLPQAGVAVVGMAIAISGTGLSYWFLERPYVRSTGVARGRVALDRSTVTH